MPDHLYGVHDHDGNALFEFDTDDLQFGRGFEAGQLFMRLAVQPTPFEQPIHNENRMMAKRMATALNRPIEIEDVNDVTCIVHAEAKPGREPVQMPQPNGEGQVVDITPRHRPMGSDPTPPPLPPEAA